MAKYRKKPIVIEAWEIPLDEEDTTREIPIWVIEAITAGVIKLISPEDSSKVSVQTKEGPLHTSPGNWIIKGIQGELYPCDKEIFLATYELME